MDVLVELYCRPGGAFAHNDRELERIRIGWEWESGQWVMITSKTNALWGWQSWYRLSRKTLLRARDYGMCGLLAGNRAIVDLTHGAACLIATTVCTPLAPRGTYRRLFELTCERNRDAERIGSVLAKRDGRTRWFERRIQEGSKRDV